MVPTDDCILAEDYFKKRVLFSTENITFLPKNTFFRGLNVINCSAKREL